MDQTLTQLLTSKQMIYFRRFNPESDVGGGARRTAQISAILDGVECAFVNARDSYERRFRELPEFQGYLDSVALPFDYFNKWQPQRREDVAYLHYIS